MRAVEGEISENWSNKLESVQYSYCVAALGLHGHPSAAGVRAEMGLVEWRMRRKSLKLRWWGRMCRMPGERLVSLLFRRRHAELVRGGAKFSALRSARELLLESGFGDEWYGRTAGNGVCEWEASVEDAMTTLAADKEDVEFRQRHSLVHYADLGHSHAKPMPLYLNDRSNLVGTRLLTKCRLGYVLLIENVGRMLNWPPARCVCVTCDDEAVEDMQHFLIECKALEPCRVLFRTEAAAALLFAGVGAQCALDALFGSDTEQMRSWCWEAWRCFR